MVRLALAHLALLELVRLAAYLAALWAAAVAEGPMLVHRQQAETAPRLRAAMAATERLARAAALARPRFRQRPMAQSAVVVVVDAPRSLILLERMAATKSLGPLQQAERQDLAEAVVGAVV